MNYDIPQSEAVLVQCEKYLSAFADGMYFKDIFPTFETFRQQLHNYNFKTHNPVDEWFAAYKVIYMRYANACVNYDTVEGFVRQFILTFEDEFDYFIRKKEKIHELLMLTNDELSKEVISISNNAMNNNKIEENPLDDVIKFISSQTSSTQISSRFESIYKGLKSAYKLAYEEFLNSFEHHFTKIYTVDIPIFSKEE